MTKKIEFVDTPKTFADAKSLYYTNNAGKIYQDKTMACFWGVRCSELIYIGVDGVCLRGNYPQSTSVWGADLCNSLRKARDNHKDLSTWGVFDKDSFNTVKRSMMKVEDLTPNMKKLWNKLKRLMKGQKVDFTLPAQKTMQFGVELELESDSTVSDEEKINLTRKYRDLIQDVGSDGSVESGAEIRFKHPTIRGWKLDQVKSILDDAKNIGLKSEWGTAGMHIHISCPNIKKAVNKFASNLFTMQNILYPINARNKMIGKTRSKQAFYGVGENIYHDQTSTFGTLEIRAWNATTNPEVFMARIRVAKAIVEFLLTDKPVTMESFFKWLPKARRADYVFLLNNENPHEFGLGSETIISMMK